jgi:hypothetical protein
MTVRTGDNRLAQTDPGGFNELKMCKSGPMLFNKFDVYVGGSLQKYGEFSVGEQDLFHAILQRGELVVEVGANIGAHTIELARLVGPEGEVHAFEPQRIVFQTLCANLALNQLTNVNASQSQSVRARNPAGSRNRSGDARQFRGVPAERRLANRCRS